MEPVPIACVTELVAEIELLLVAPKEVELVGDSVRDAVEDFEDVRVPVTVRERVKEPV